MDLFVAHGFARPGSFGTDSMWVDVRSLDDERIMLTNSTGAFGIEAAIVLRRLGGA